MKYLKEEKGVTLVVLVTTIVILLIITAVGLNIGNLGAETAEDSKLVSELGIVQHAIIEQYTKYKTTKDVSFLVGNKITKEQAMQYAEEIGVTLVNIPETYLNKDYYKLDVDDLSEIGIQHATDEYIVNYISGEVINITIKKTSDNNPLYIKANSFQTI